MQETTSSLINQLKLDQFVTAKWFYCNILRLERGHLLSSKTMSLKLINRHSQRQLDAKTKIKEKFFSLQRGRTLEKHQNMCFLTYRPVSSYQNMVEYVLLKLSKIKMIKRWRHLFQAWESKKLERRCSTHNACSTQLETFLNHSSNSSTLSMTGHGLESK